MKRRLTLLFLTIIGLGMMFLADSAYRGQIRRENDRTLTQAAADIQNRLQVAVNTRLRAVEDLQAFMLAAPELPSSDMFDRYSTAVLDHYPDIRAFQYVDNDRIIRYIYPLAGNEAALGLDLMTRPAAPFIEKAIAERRTTVNDPTETVQGSLSIVARSPLFKGDELVGLVQGVFDVNAIQKDALAGADIRFDIRLEDSKGRFFYGTETITEPSQSITVPVGDNYWLLAVDWMEEKPTPSNLILAMIWFGGGALLSSLLFILNRQMAATENRLQHLAQRNQLIMETSPDAITMTDLEGNITACNRQTAVLHGYASPEELIGLGSLALIAPEDHERAMQNLTRAFQGEIIRDIPYTLQRRDGTVFPGELSPVLITNDAGEPEAFIATTRDITERKRAELSLQESEERFRLLVNESPYAIGVHQDGQVVFVNPAAVRLFGAKTAVDLIGLPVDRLIAPENWPAARARIERMLRGETGLYPIEDVYMRLDGTAVPVEVTAAPFTFNNKPAVQVIALDITDRKQVAEELRRSFLAEREQRALAEALRDTAVALNEARTLEDVLDAIMDSMNHVIDQDARDIMMIRDGLAHTVRASGSVEVDYEAWQQAVVLPVATTMDLMRMIETHKPITIADTQENEAWVPIAETKWIRSCITAPINIKETAVGFISIYSAEPNQFSQQDSRRLAGFAEQAAIGIEKAQLIVDLERQNLELEERVAERTQSLEQQYGRQAALAEIELAISEPYELQDALKRIARLVHKNLPASRGASVILWDEETERFTISAATIPDQDERLASKRVRRKNGATRWIIENKKPLVVADIRNDPFGANRMLDEYALQAYAGVPILDGQRPMGVLYALESTPRQFTKDDLDFMQIIAARAAVAIIKVALFEEIKAANRLLAERHEELQRRNRELETFTYSVSHDLKAPLRGIDGYSRLLLEDYGEELDENGRFFLRTVRKATLQMNDLIEDLLLYSRLERREMRAGPILPLNLIENLLAERTEEITERKITVNVAAPETAVVADSDGLAMALRNLLDNALKFTRDSDQPRIEIGGRETETLCIIWVRDNGTGFDMKFHSRIFEIFQRLHRAEDYPGTGIGLAIVQKAMARMNGRVWAESELGKGATFYLEIPRSHQ